MCQRVKKGCLIAVNRLNYSSGPINLRWPCIYRSYAWEARILNGTYVFNNVVYALEGLTIVAAKMLRTFNERLPNLLLPLPGCLRSWL